MKNTVYLYVFDTMADWEIGYITAELNSGRYYKQGLAPSKIVTVGMEKTPVTTMGGLKILPDIKLDECSIERTDALILPGGDTWTEAIHQPILKIAQRCLKEGILVAAICGAIMGLAQAGLLNSRPHTSNDLEYLKMICPTYTGKEYYKMESVVTDGKLITASGIAPLEFSVHVLKALDVLSSQTLDAWYSKGISIGLRDLTEVESRIMEPNSPECNIYFSHNYAKLKSVSFSREKEGASDSEMG